MTIEDATLVVARAFERLKVPYYVTGSIASSLHGEPRATNDADLVAELHLHHGDALARELAGRFFVDLEEVAYAVTNERSFNLIDEVELAKIDVFCVRRLGYQAAALARAVRRDLQPDDPFSEATIASAEDSLLSKLRWYRLGNEVSDRQWRDVLGLIAAQRAVLDHAYLSQWARELGVDDLLARALAAER